MTFRCRALLFDLDGTLIDSLPAVERAWGAWAVLRGFDPAELLSKIHGRRSIDSVRDLRPDLNAEEEDAWLRHMESTDTDGVTTLPGAKDFVLGLREGCFAYVTSGTSDVAGARLRHLGMPTPDESVYGEDVANGKPAPDPYLLAAQRLGIEPSECLVFEDTPAGVRSARAAGMRVVGIATWKTPEDLAEADAVVRNFTHLSCMLAEDGTEIEVTVSS